MGWPRLRAEFDMAMVFRLAMVCFGSAYLVEIGQQHRVDAALCVNISQDIHENPDVSCQGLLQA
jgi:hypothetical protein